MRSDLTEKEDEGSLAMGSDLIEKEDAKDELHQRVDDLHDKLWKIMEDKKLEANNERKAIQESGWVEG